MFTDIYKNIGDGNHIWEQPIFWKLLTMVCRSIKSKQMNLCWQATNIVIPWLQSPCLSNLTTSWSSSRLAGQEVLTQLQRSAGSTGKSFAEVLLKFFFKHDNSNLFQVWLMNKFEIMNEINLLNCELWKIYKAKTLLAMYVARFLAHAVVWSVASFSISSWIPRESHSLSWRRSVSNKNGIIELTHGNTQQTEPIRWHRFENVLKATVLSSLSVLLLVRCCLLLRTQQQKAF